MVDIARIQEIGIEAFVAKMPPDQVNEILAQMLNIEERQKYGRFDALFPDNGPLRRELYVKHLEFFRTGKSYRERCIMAGNRVGKCRLYNDLVPHPDGTVSRIGDLFVAAKPFDVWAWDGERMVAASVSHVVRKPPEKAVEIFLSGGQRFTCSLDHRVLTQGGYVFVSRLLASVPCLPPTSGASDPLTRAASEKRCLEKELDYSDHYSMDCHRCDAQPLDLKEVVRELQTQSCDARQHTPALWPWGGLARKSDDSLSQHEPRLSSRYGQSQSVVPCVASQGQGDDTFARRTLCLQQEAQPRAAALSNLPQSFDEAGLDQFWPGALVTPDMAGNHVVGYRHVGVHALYDMTVPVFENYIADGIIHHNTICGSYEVSCHLTGNYPHWWEGRVFPHPVRAWAAGKTNETTRDIIQNELLGSIAFEGQRKIVDGTGLIPREKLGVEAGQMSWKAGVADLVDTIRVQHKTGGWSELGLKSYQQGRGSFEGTARHVIWFDEEPPADVYGEALIRTATTRGIIMLTFTPLDGMSDVVQSFLPREMRPGGA